MACHSSSARGMSSSYLDASSRASHLLQKRGFELDFLRDETVHGEAACFDDAMLERTARQDADRRF
jgi:hypothetical protein